MSMARARAFWIGLGLLAAGAAAAQNAERECVPLDATEAARLRNIVVMSAIPQADVMATTMPRIRTHVQPPVNAGGGGIIGALIGGLIVDAIINSDVKRSSERAALAFPSLLEQTRDFDFRREFWDRLREAMDRDTRFKTLDVATFSERGHVEQPDTVRGEPVDALLDLRTEYAMSPDLRAFIIRTEVLLQSRPDARELYRCSYHFVTPPVGGGVFETAIGTWAAQEGALYRAAALIGIEQTLGMLRLDLTGQDAPRPSGAETRIAAVAWQPGVVIHAPLSANVVDRVDGVVIARDSRGHMRAAVEGEVFSPSPEAIAAVSQPARGDGAGRSGPVAIEDLLGAMSEEARILPVASQPAAPEKAAPSQPAAAEEPAARRGAPDDLEGLLGR
jgi:hypothetical protein